MPVVLTILAILGVLAGLLLALTVLLLWVRAGVEAVGVNGEVSVEVRYGALRIPVWPPPRHLKKQPAQTPQQAAPAKPKRKKPKKYKYSFNRQVDLREALGDALTLVGELADRVRISRLRVRVRIGTDDAAKTGLLLGSSAAVTGMIVPVLENTFEMKDYHVDVDADFEADHTEWAFTVFCSVRPLLLLFWLLRRVTRLRGLIRKLIKKEEAIAHE